MAGCGDVLSLEDLQTAKKHQIFEAEVITGKAGGVAGGATIGTATNPVTGQTQQTLPSILADLGFDVQSWTSSTGGVLASANQVFLNDTSGSLGLGDYYAWGGTFPKTVPAGTDPALVGSGYIMRSSRFAGTQARESLRRSYAEAGYNVVGTFQAGFTIVNPNDIGIDLATGKGYTGPAGTVAAGTNPASGGFVDRSGTYLRQSFAATIAEMKASNLSPGSVVITSGYRTSSDGCGATYRIITAAEFGGTPDGFADHTMANGNVAVLQIAEAVNVKHFGADPAGVIPAHTHFQAAVNRAEAKRYSVLRVPMETNERYRLDVPVVFKTGGFVVRGGAAVGSGRNAFYGGACVFGDSAHYFDYGGGLSNLTDSFTVEGIRFYDPNSGTGGPGNPKTKIGIKITQNNNGPHRPIKIVDCSADGMLDVIRVQAPTAATGAAGLEVDGGNFANCTNLINAITKVYGCHVHDCQPEGGARIIGDLDGPVEIDNIINEGQSQPIDISVGTGGPMITVGGNYSEAPSGDFYCRLSALGESASAKLGDNWGVRTSGNTAKSIYRLEGSWRLYCEGADPLTRTFNQTDPVQIYSPYTLHKARLQPYSEGRGYGFQVLVLSSASGNDSCGFLETAPYLGNVALSGAYRDDNLGAIAALTPYGKTTTAIQKQSFTLDKSGVPFTFSAGECIGVSALIRIDNYGSVDLDKISPIMVLYDSAGSTAGIVNENGAIRLNIRDCGKWFLMFGVFTTKIASGASCRFGFGPFSVAGVTSAAKLTVAAVNLSKPLAVPSNPNMYYFNPSI